MPAGAASRYALGADGVGAARPAPAASQISASRYALGARRTALRAEGAARLCAKRRSRWLPSPPRATRSPPRAWALRARAPAAAFSPPRATRSAPTAWALRARAPTCCPPPITARCLLVVGTSKTSCASRCSRRSVQGALRAPAEGEGGEGWSRHHHARAFGERLCAAGACAKRVGAERRWDSPRPGRPPALSARVLQRFALERCGHVGAARRRPSRLTLNNGHFFRVPKKPARAARGARSAPEGRREAPRSGAGCRAAAQSAATGG